jgi:hypothetical protein
MLSDYQALVTNFVRDDASKISTTDRDTAIASAVERYSQDRPVEKAADLVGVSGQLIALPAAWEAEFSALKSLEYPVGDVPPSLLESDAWALYRDVDVLRIMLAASLPAASTVRAVFTVRHTLTTLVDTIPTGRREVVAKFAAASLCDQLAALYANDTDSTIGAGMVQGQTKSQAYAARARDYRKQYQDALGVTDRTAQPASAVGSLRPKDGHGQPRLFHPPGRLLS